MTNVGPKNKNGSGGLQGYPQISYRINQHYSIPRGKSGLAGHAQHNMSISSPSRQLLRCFSAPASSQLPRASPCTPPRTPRPLASIAHCFTAPKEAAVPATLQEIQEETEASNKANQTTSNEEYMAWRPPNYARKPPRQSDRVSLAIFDHKPQSGIPPNRQIPRTQDSLQPQLKAETSSKARRKFPSAEELAVPLYRDALSLRWETLPPTTDQLKATERFFLQQPPKFLWSADKFKTIDYGNVPEV